MPGLLAKPASRIGNTPFSPIRQLCHARGHSLCLPRSLAVKSAKARPLWPRHFHGTAPPASKKGGGNLRQAFRLSHFETSGLALILL
jgi:hypothetical protein